MTAAQRTTAREMRRDGETIPVVAARLGVPETTIGDHTRAEYRQRLADRDERIRTLRAEGQTLTEIGAAVGLVPSSVAYRLRRMGVA